MYLLGFALDYDAVPLVVVETDPRRPDLHVQLAAAQVDVERHGAVAQRQRQVILAVTCA